MEKFPYGGYINYPGKGVIKDSDVYELVVKHSSLDDRLNPEKMAEMTLLAQTVLMGIYEHVDPDGVMTLCDRLGDCGREMQRSPLFFVRNRNIHLYRRWINMPKMVSGELFNKYAEVLHEEQRLAIEWCALAQTMCSYINEKMENPMAYFTDRVNELEERRKELFQKYLDI